jgi:two-component system, NarL family, response regulator LiaR
MANHTLHSEPLTEREREVAYAVSRGLRNRAIAGACGISEETVKKHLVNIYGKLAINGRVQLAIHLLKGGAL